MRFAAYGWNVIPNVDGHDVARDRTPRSRKRARTPAKPTLICCKTVIGKGAPTQAPGTAKAHGAALGEAEVAATRAALGWNYPPFEIPDGRLPRMGRARRTAPRSRASGTRASRPTSAAHPEARGANSRRRMAGKLPDGWQARVQAMLAEGGREGRVGRHAQGFAARARGARARTSRSCSAARRTSPAPTSPTGRARRR